MVFRPRVWSWTRWPVRCLALLGAVVCGWACALGVAAPAVAADKPAEAAVPVKKVVLYSSGVGYFERSGEVEGDAKLDLRFQTAEVNDLLKSLVPRDLGGGQVSTVTYGSMDPITRTLKTFAIDLTDNPTLGALLAQVRGEGVEIRQGGQPTEGTIVGLEKRREEAGDEVIEREFLLLLTSGGLRSFALDAIESVRLTNPSLDADLRQALGVLALGHSTDKKTVSLQFTGKGRRPVRVGYVLETPIWKTSYRLVLADGQEPTLQGWAIVENTTEDDWRDVRLTLVSGRPISFVMNLYQPLYVPRPEVVPELFASLAPQTYGQDMDRAEQEFAARKAAPAPAMAAAPAAPPAPSRLRAAEGFASGGGGFGADQQADKLESLALGRGVQSLATAEEVGELFQYEIAVPVSLARQQSALLPIVTAPVKADKLSIYNAAVHAKHPLRGLRFVNSTDLHLMQGPITVFDDGAYAGDAQIEDLPPKSERLVSYALDLETEVAPLPKPVTTELVGVKIYRGTLYSSHRLRRQQEFTVKNSDSEPKTVLIEWPLDNTWKLLEPAKPTETTRDRYRFAVEAAPGKPEKLSIVEEQTRSETVGVANVDDGLILLYQRSDVVSGPVKSALAEIQSRKQNLARIREQIQRIEQTVQAISQDQSRMRDNMGRLDRNAPLYQRYVAKLDAQENELEQHRLQLEELAVELAEAQRSFEEFIGGLDVK